MITKTNLLRLLKFFPLLIILIFFFQKRIPVFENPSRDYNTFQFAVVKFIQGENLYKHTILTYENQEAFTGDLGYAYLSGFLFLYSGLYLLSLMTGINENILYKIPNLIADLGTGFLLYYLISKKNYWAGVVAFGVWFINPYLLFRDGYTYNDIIPLFLALVSFILIRKNAVISGAFFGLSIVFKTFPLIFFPLLLIYAKNKKDFILSIIIIGLATSIPFMTSVETFVDYIRGSLLVHGERSIQGRPFLFYLSYWFDIELIQVIPTRVYSFLALFGGWALTLILIYYFKIKELYLLSLLVSLNFYFFTPVLNRTYLLWFFPFIILGAATFLQTKKYVYYGIILGYYLLYYFYLKDWGLGFHEVIPF